VTSFGETSKHIHVEDIMRQTSKVVSVLGAAILATAAAAAGCAVAPLHTEKTTAGIRAAEEVGAAKVPQAALHLQLAKEQMRHAKALAKDGQEQQADSMLSRARVDAELAVALSRVKDEKNQAERALARVRQLQRENK
jgi:hypothetical protein